MAVRLIKSDEIRRCPAWVLPYPDSLILSKGQVLIASPAEGQCDLVAGQLRFKGDLADILDGLTLLAGAEREDRIEISDGLTLSWYKKRGDKVLLRGPATAGQKRPLAVIRFDNLAALISEIIVADSPARLA